MYVRALNPARPFATQSGHTAIGTHGARRRHRPGAEIKVLLVFHHSPTEWYEVPVRCCWLLSGGRGHTEHTERWRGRGSACRRTIMVARS